MLGDRHSIGKEGKEDKNLQTSCAYRIVDKHSMPVATMR